MKPSGGEGGSQAVSVLYLCCQAAGHAFSGHSSHVTNVQFLYDDSRLLSSGGKDSAVLQWQVVDSATVITGSPWRRHTHQYYELCFVWSTQGFICHILTAGVAWPTAKSLAALDLILDPEPCPTTPGTILVEICKLLWFMLTSIESIDFFRLEKIH